MLETILLAILLAKFKGYKIKPIFKNWCIYPVIFVEIINLIGQVMIFTGSYEYVGFISYLKPIYLILYLILVFRYNLYISSIIGAICIFIGGILNDIAIKANNGFMPVYPSLSYITGYVKNDVFQEVSKIHVLGNAETKVKFLTDYIDLGYSILSVGDLFIRIFILLIIYNSIKAINITKERG